MFMFKEIKEILMPSKRNDVDSKLISAGVEDVLTNLLGASLVRKIDFEINNTRADVNTRRASFPECQCIVVSLDLVISCSKEFNNETTILAKLTRQRCFHISDETGWGS